MFIESNIAKYVMLLNSVVVSSPPSTTVPHGPTASSTSETMRNNIATPKKIQILLRNSLRTERERSDAFGKNMIYVIKAASSPKDPALTTLCRFLLTSNSLSRISPLMSSNQTWRIMLPVLY